VGSLFQRGISPKAIGDMLSDMRTMSGKYGAHTKLPPSEQAHVQTIEELVEQNLLPALKVTRDDAEAELHTLIAAITACNGNSTLHQYGLETTTAVTVNTSRGTHKICRLAEDVLFNDKTQKCNDLNIFTEGVHVPATLPTAPTGSTLDTEAMGQYLEKMEDYFCGKYSIWEAKNSACNNATIVWTNKTRRVT
jgi:hypothetical protein